MEKSEKMFFDMAQYSLASYLVKVFDFIAGIVIRRILEPATMGTFSLLMLIFQYAKYHHLGIYDSLDREIPYFNGKGDYGRSHKIRDLGFNFGLVSAIAVSFFLIFSGFFLNLDLKLKNGLWFLAILVVFQAVITYSIILARTHHRFAMLSKYNVFIAVIEAIVTIYLAITFGLYGVLAASIVVALIGIIYFYKNDIHFKIHLVFPASEVLRLFRIGFPILLYNFIFISLLSIDRFMIIAFLDKTQLGYYSIATMMSTYLILLPNLLYTVLFPRFLEAFGRRGDIKELKNYFLIPTFAIAYLLALIIGVVILLLPPLIRFFLPKYLPGLTAAHILVLGTFFVSILGMSNYVLYALNKQSRMVFMGLSAIFIGVILEYLFIKKFQAGLEGVALGMLITFFLYSIFLMSYALKNYTKKLLDFLKFFIKIFFPFLWALFILLSLNFLFKGNPERNSFSYTFLQLLIFIICYMPLLFYLNKKTLILSKVYELVKFKK